MTLVAATTETIDAMCYDSVKGWTAKYEDHSRVKLSAYTVPEDARGPTTWRGRSRSLSWRLSSEEGVKIFDPERKTALCTDYSDRRGIFPISEVVLVQVGRDHVLPDWLEGHSRWITVPPQG